jgi:2-dehydro-3-deoxygalactonokinase
MKGWIAVDWGTSRLRATRMEGDAAGETRTSEAGMATLDRDGFAPALRALVGDWLPAPVLAAGMVGARQGWFEAPYRPVPCTPLGPPVAVPGDMDIRIVPGLRQTRPHPDVMRGEEVQVAGLLAADSDFDGTICLPGTHTKWVHVSAGEVVSFRTAMTGELFAALTAHTVLRHSLGGDGWAEAPFLHAVSAALARPEALLVRMFELRAADLLHGQDATTARSALSGLLIGAELAATRPWWLGREVALIGAEPLSNAYAAALEMQGVPTRRMPVDATTIAGLAAARKSQ